MLTLNQVSALSEDKARETLERILWPNGPVCPHCRTVENLTRLQGKAHRTGVFQCNNCHDQFSVTVGTIFEDSHIPLRKWLMAFALLCSAKKGISALQLQRELELGSYRTAWHMAHRIRHAMSKEPLAGLLRGTVEVDETMLIRLRDKRLKGLGLSSFGVSSHNGGLLPCMTSKTLSQVLIHRCQARSFLVLSHLAGDLV